MNLLDIAYALTIGPHYCYHRLCTGKYGPKAREKTGRIPDRFKSSATAVMGLGDPHFEAPCLWLHAVSVGEAVACRDLARMFMQDNPRWEIKASATTATGRSILEKEFGEDRVFYYPLDFSGMVKRAFDNIRPTMIVLMELEIWPNFLAEAVRRKTPVVVANARITERSVKRLAYVPSIAKRMATAVEAWFAQTEVYAQRLEKIGVPANRIEVTGSVKYDAVPADIDERVGVRYRKLFGCDEQYHADGGRLLVVGGSTHPGEEKALLAALQSAVPDGMATPRVVLTPRHPERLDEVEREAGAFGRVVRRSALPDLPDDTPWCGADIVLVDTIGELAKIYAAADLVFVGGTLIPHGGQNFIEPCGLSKATVVGPNVWNFSEPAELLGSEGCIGMVQNDEELAAWLQEMIADPAKGRAMGEQARQLLLKQRGAARRMADRINVLARCITRKN